MNPSITVKTDKPFIPLSINNDDDESLYAATDETIMPETILHYLLGVRLTSSLLTFFAQQENVEVFGNLMFYYDEENHGKVVSPDLMVCFDLAEIPRRVYRLWKQQSVPSFVLEIASKTTWFNDTSSKVGLYQKLGVQEYFVFDPEYQYLPSPLIAFRLIDGVLVEQEVSGGRIYSQTLGLELVDTGKTLRFFNPETNEFLLTQEEIQTKFAEAEAKAEQAEAKAEQAQAKAEQAQAENERLKAELAELRKQNGK